MPFVTAPDGIRLHYEVAGEGQPIVLHLGAGCSADLWRAAGYVDLLARQYQLILFDHRGHGASDDPGTVAGHHIDRYVDDVGALLDHLDIASTCVWGWSNGLTVACAVAHHYPDRVRSLVLAGSVGPPLAGAALMEAVEVRVAALRASGWNLLIDGFKEEEGLCPEWMADRIRATNLNQLILWQTARLDWPESPWDILVKTRHRSLMLVGDLEDPEGLMSQAAAQMADATEVRLDGVGHIKAFLASDRVAPHVEAFLEAGSR